MGVRIAGSIHRDLASAYLVTGARVGSWAVISALVLRRLGPDSFAMLALIRSTVGLLGYTALGLGPAMIRFLAEAARPQRVQPLPWAPSGENAGSAVLPYQTPPASPRPRGTPQQRAYATGERVAMLSAGIGLVVAMVYMGALPVVHRIPANWVAQATDLAWGLSVGMIFRLMSDAPASALQVNGRIALDNLFLIVAEGIWLLLSCAALLSARLGLPAVGASFLLANLLLLTLRILASRLTCGQITAPASPDWRVAVRMIRFGLGVAIAQAADFLYAPTDYILINRLLDPAAVAVYAPAVQIDAGLMLAVSALATVLLPRAALAHATGNRQAVRRYYVGGTLVSFAMLTVGAAVVWSISGPLLRAWLGSDQPRTQAILPLVLIHTVIGGSSAVGRAVLLAMGKVRPFTAAVLIAGAANVALSFSFVWFFGMGLRGIILGTIIAVVGRCAIWMPLYIASVLREQEVP